MAKGEGALKLTFRDVAGCLGDRATDGLAPGPRQTFQSQTRTRSKDVLVTSGVAQGIKQRCNVAR